MHRLRYLAAVVLFTIGLAPNLGADWPQWRGPDGTGIARDAAPLEWRPDANVAWRAEIGGLGVSSPIVSGNKVIVTSQASFAPLRSGFHPTLAGGAIDGADQPLGGSRQDGAGGVRFLIEAFDRASGSTLWTHTVIARGPLQPVHEKANLASSSPVTDGERVYAVFGTGQTVALTMDGNEVWSRHLGEEYGPFAIVWGHSSSPVVYQDLLILQCDHSSATHVEQASGAYLVALDTRTGQERWKVERGPGLFSYSTPFVVPGPDGDELVVNSSQRLDAYDPGTGGSSPASMRRRVSECGGNASVARTLPHLWRPTVASTSSVKLARRSCSRVGVTRSSWPETTSRPAFLRLRRSPTARSSSAPTAISSPSEAEQDPHSYLPLRS